MTSDTATEFTRFWNAYRKSPLTGTPVLLSSLLSLIRVHSTPIYCLLFLLPLNSFTLHLHCPLLPPLLSTPLHSTPFLSFATRPLFLYSLFFIRCPLFLLILPVFFCPLSFVLLPLSFVLCPSSSSLFFFRP